MSCWGHRRIWAGPALSSASQTLAVALRVWLYLCRPPGALCLGGTSGWRPQPPVPVGPPLWHPQPAGLCPEEPVPPSAPGPACDSWGRGGDAHPITTWGPRAEVRCLTHVGGPGIPESPFFPHERPFRPPEAHPAPAASLSLFLQHPTECRGRNLTPRLRPQRAGRPLGRLLSHGEGAPGTRTLWRPAGSGRPWGSCPAPSPWEKVLRAQILGSEFPRGPHTVAFPPLNRMLARDPH